jgi:TolB-like protein/DNA-binding SARP family transcriptional activator
MIRLQLFGSPLLRDPEPVTGPAAQRQRLALLALLALGRNAGVSRDRLIALLWPEADTERGRHVLSNSVYVIRRALGGDVVLSQGDALRLNSACIGSDVGDFLDALDAGDCAMAAALCGQPFLDGFYLPGADEFERWVADERDRLGRACADALERLAEEAEARQEFRAAAGWWQRLAAADPYSSRTVLRLMQAMAAGGEPAAALRQGRIHERRLRQDFEAPLPTDVVELASRLTRATGHVPPAPATPAATPVPVPAGTAAATPAARWPDPTPRRRSTVLAVAVLPLLLLASGVVIRLAILPAADRPVATPAHSIAVLPFVNLSADPGDEYFSDGLTEELINQLASIDGLRVTARTSAFAYKGVQTEVGEIGRRLNVALLLEGSVRRTGDRMRITAQLIDAGDGYHRWSHEWERASTDIFSIQDEIAREIAAIVRLDLPAASSHPGTRDMQAFEAYSRGRHAFWQGSGRADLEEAIGHYRAALAHDPRYARAWAGLADAYMLLPGPPAERMHTAKDAALRALSYDGDLSEGWVALASINWFFDWDWAAAELHYRRSFSDPRPGVYTRCICYVWYLAAIGDMDGAAREAIRARTVDPVSLLPLLTLAQVYLAARRADDLRALLPELRATGAGNGTLDFFAAWLDWDAGHREDARERLERLLAGRDPDAHARHNDPGLVAALAFMTAGTGHTATARALARALRARAAEEYVSPVLLASAFTAAGDTLEAERWIGAALEGRENLGYYAVTSAARPLHELPAFRAALRQVGVPGRN